MAFQYTIAQPFVSEGKFINSLSALNLLSHLKVCLDASDAASYTSGQKWLDRSGNGYDFFLGDDATTESTRDPAFSGTVGGQSKNEYFSDVGLGSVTALCRYDSANESWMENFHKNNAQFSFAGWFRPSNVGSTRYYFFGTNAINSGNIGATVYYDTADESMHLVVTNGAGFCINSTVLVGNMTGGGNQRFFFAGAIDEAANVQRYQTSSNITLTTVQASSTCTYTSPSSSSATYTMELLSAGNNTKTSARLGFYHNLAIWEGRALTATEMDLIFNATVAKFS